MIWMKIKVGNDRFVVGIIFLIASVVMFGEGTNILGEEQVIDGVKKIDYHQWKECYRIKNKEVQVIVAPAFGGRIVNYSIGGTNIICEEFRYPDGSKRSWGHQIEVVPFDSDMNRKIEPFWSESYKAEVVGPYSIREESRIHPQFGIKMVNEITLDPGSSRLKVIHKVVNVSGQPRKWYLWDRTLLLGQGYIFFPLNPSSIFPRRWVILNGGNIEKFPQDKYCLAMNGLLILHASENVTKGTFVGTDSDAGWIAYIREDILYIKNVSYSPEGNYNRAHHFSIAAFFANNRAELEPSSPVFEIGQGEKYEFIEEWYLIKVKRPVNSFDEVSRFQKIVESVIKQDRE